MVRREREIERERERALKNPFLTNSSCVGEAIFPLGHGNPLNLQNYKISLTKVLGHLLGHFRHCVHVIYWVGEPVRVGCMGVIVI